MDPKLPSPVPEMQASRATPLPASPLRHQAPESGPLAPTPSSTTFSRRRQPCCWRCIATPQTPTPQPPPAPVRQARTQHQSCPTPRQKPPAGRSNLVAKNQDATCTNHWRDHVLTPDRTIAMQLLYAEQPGFSNSRIAVDPNRRVPRVSFVSPKQSVIRRLDRIFTKIDPHTARFRSSHSTPRSSTRKTSPLAPACTPAGVGNSGCVDAR